jgi:hypothetical protein
VQTPLNIDKIGSIFAPAGETLDAEEAESDCFGFFASLPSTPVEDEQ